MGKIIEGEYKVDHKGTYTNNKFKIGNNQPCPCQSGNKYKKCCKGKRLFVKEDLTKR